MRFYRLICVSLCALVFGSLSSAQPDSGRIEGQLSPMQGSLPNYLSIEVLSEGRVIDRADPARDGSFALRHLPAGRYEVRVVDVRGDVLRSDVVNIGSQTSHLEMRLPGVRQERPASGSVSIDALTKPTPKNIRKQLERAGKEFAKGNVQASLRHLENATELCPECAEAHNSLGVRYMQMNAFDKAVPAFSRAVELDPRSATPRTNLALALVTMREYDKAEPFARKAYELDRGSVPARYALGLIALNKRQCTTEALSHLSVAADIYPRAHLSAATMFQCRGETNDAIAHLTAYLAIPNAEHRDRVDAWLRQLRTAGQ